jgi:hypothetical protein
MPGQDSVMFANGKSGRNKRIEFNIATTQTQNS